MLGMWNVNNNTYYTFFLQITTNVQSITFVIWAKTQSCMWKYTNIIMNWSWQFICVWVFQISQCNICVGDYCNVNKKIYKNCSKKKKVSKDNSQ